MKTKEAARKDIQTHTPPPPLFQALVCLRSPLRPEKNHKARAPDSVTLSVGKSIEHAVFDSMTCVPMIERQRVVSCGLRLGAQFAKNCCGNNAELLELELKS
jgi:hypothetical protein